MVLKANWVILLLFVLLAGGTCFFCSHLFSDSLLLPKWIVGILLSAILIVVVSVTTKYPVNGDTVRTASVAFCSISSVSSIIGICQFFEQPRFWLTTGTQGCFGNVCGYASALCFTLPYVCYLKTCSTVKCIVAFAIISGILLSGSRTAMLSLLFTSLVYLALTRPELIRQNKLTILFVLVATCTLLYFFKKDSADGRILIWLCALAMFLEKPLLGHGCGGVYAHYMDYQAEYFSVHPKSNYVMLADNIRDVFNEYLGIAVEYGLVGIIAVFLFGIFVLLLYVKGRQMVTRPAFCSVICIAIFSMFSFPFSYPYTTVIFFCSLFIIVRYSHCHILPRSFEYKKTIRYLVVACCLVTSAVTCMYARNDIRWQAVALEIDNKSTIGKDILEQYRHLLPDHRRNPYFLYNYAVVLYEVEDYKNASRICHICKTYWADYDLEMLDGMIYEGMNDIHSAASCYGKAHQMCPNRLWPFYNLAWLYYDNGNFEDAAIYARKGLDLHGKVESLEYRKMKENLRMILSQSKSINN